MMTRDVVKRCQNFDMLCSTPNSCSYEGLRIPNYEWMKPHTGVVFNCHFYKRTIVVAEKSSNLFGVDGCTADKRACNLHDSIIIWDTDIIDECAYDDNDDLIDKTNKLLFKVIGNDTIPCITSFQNRKIVSAFYIYLTAEGLWLTRNPYFSKQDIVNGTTLKTANEFILADKDNTERILFRLFQHVAEEVCFQLLTTIRALSRLNVEVIKLEDTNGEPYVLYAHNGNVFIPTCVNVNTIFVLSNYTNCYEDLPVIVQYLSAFRTFLTFFVSAFLTTDLILQPTSRVINCDLLF